MINLDFIKTLEGGMSNGFVDNVEGKNTYTKGINGRLYSDNGTISFAAGKGTKLVYENEQIVKYLGYYSFQNELIVFAKCLKAAATQTVNTVCTKTINVSFFTVSTNLTSIALTTEFSDNSEEIEICQDVTITVHDETDFQLNFNCGDVTTDTVNMDDYFLEDLTVQNLLNCNLSTGSVPMNNRKYYDCILSLKKSNNVLVGKMLWVGMQNWHFDSKITTDGVEENEFYKRVYYTDVINFRRVVNIKDPRLQYRTENEFNQVLNNVLLQPIVHEIKPGGQLKVMRSHYVYRIISENGQLSEFSPSSFFAEILAEEDAVEYRGGRISETTSLYVTVKCNIINHENSSLIECVAIEYEALGVPTAIRSLGMKAAASVVYFEHFGNEAEFADALTYNDIINFTNTWKYCNDFASKKNKLIACGLRNVPIPTEINNLEYLFMLHGWKKNGTTHDCLINPAPWEFRYIDPLMQGKLVFIKKKVYITISSFGPLILRLNNRTTGAYIEVEFSTLSLSNYTNIIELIYAWLLDQKTNNPAFATFFPNLNIENPSGQLFFVPIDDNIDTDMANYSFSTTNNQYIENFDNDIEFLTPTVNTARMVWGAQSIGFNEGTGVRITYREFKRPLLNQATAPYDGTGLILDYETPLKEQFFMKGEIYRLSLQAYNNDSTSFFTIPMGDIMVPEINDLKLEIDNTGNPVITSEKYLSQSVDNGILYGHGIKMHVEVRLSCELQALIPMYEILYVERTEENRTILCQGMAAPLNRVQHNTDPGQDMPATVKNKWNLPYYGGPVYEQAGLNQYDVNGEDYQFYGDEAEKRIITSRSLMYFDAPDIYYKKISSKFVDNSVMNIVGRLNTDHTPGVIARRGNMTVPNSSPFGGASDVTVPGDEIYPKFSRKIKEHQIAGDNHSSDLPRRAVEEGEVGTFETHFINVSVMAKYLAKKQNINIRHYREMKQGEIVSGAAFGIFNSVSNNTFGLSSQPWYYGGKQRNWHNDTTSGEAASDVFTSARTSIGYETIIIKAEEDLFTSAFIGSGLGSNFSEIRQGGDSSNLYDSYALINIFRNNRESVYGGRTKQSLSRNIYIPLSGTIPTNKKSNGTQYFDMDGDTYVTLNIRVKNAFGNDELYERDLNNGSGRDNGDITAWDRNAAWAYVNVLETTVEPKMNYEYEFYRTAGIHEFFSARPELINGAYFNTNNLKNYIAKPFRYKDDPNRDNVLAVSNVKIAGEQYDSWTVFKPNNFYAELEKNMGACTNLVKQEDEVFCVQERQTSSISIGVDRIINDSQGRPINVKQGSGDVVEGHTVISGYGTSIRRAVCENEFGFVFFDETAVEFVKVDQPLFYKLDLHFDYMNRFLNDKIVDTEAFFDYENKESNILLRTKSGLEYIVSFNEKFTKFNGEFQHAKDLYMEFNKEVFAPIRTSVLNPITDEIDYLSKDVHQLNRGDILNYFNEQKTLILGYMLTNTIDKVFQFKSWGLVTNIKYPIKRIFVKSNLGYDRTILGTHSWYKLREGNHTVPMINDTIVNADVTDVRGNWVYVETEVESLNNSEIKLVSFINNLRISHQ
jgi:hypothetical protein